MADYIQPVANGIRTDHPYPNLPFVDDSHIPIDDPSSIEKIGRIEEDGTWGRKDADRSTGEWIAFTTDPHNYAYGWLVQYHPEHGRSVLLYRDTSLAYQSWWQDRPLLTRSGGYWWDGTSWYRPAQVMDRAAEGCARRRVPHPSTVTAADVLAASRIRSQVATASNTASWGRVHKVARFEAASVPDEQWRNDLAQWAEQQKSRADALPLNRCVIELNAPELSQLLSVEDIAGQTGESADRLRKDFDRDYPEALPSPQATVDGHPRWSRPVVQDWREERRRDSPEDILTGNESGPSSAVSALWARLTTNFTEDLQHRTGNGGFLQRVLSSVTGPAPTRDTAPELAWTAALQAEDMLPPLEPTIHVIEQAVLREFATAPAPPGGVRELDLTEPTGRLLVWFVEHMPRSVPALFGAIVGEADRREVVAREVAINTLRSTVLFESGKRFDTDTLKQFLDACLPPDWQD